MRKAALVLCTAMIGMTAIAQPNPKKDKSRKPHQANTTWTKGALLSVTASQGSSKNWSAGAQDFALSLNAWGSIYANKKWGKNSWDNNLEGSFGVYNTTGLGVRKNDDRVDFRSKYGYQVAKQFNVGVLANFRSQFTDGYDYSDGQKRRISDWFAPAYFVLAPGAEWKPSSHFSIFGSPFAGRTVVFTNMPYSYMYQGGVMPDGGTETPLSSKYGVNPQRQVDGQFGAFASVNINTTLCKNVSLRSRADFFADYLDRRPQNVDIFWTNAIVMHVNKVLSVTYNFDVNYDDDIRLWGPNKNATRFQFRSLLGVGVAVKL